MPSAVETDGGRASHEENASFGEDLVIVTAPTGLERVNLSAFDGYVEERLFVEVRLVYHSEEYPHRVVSLGHSDDVVAVVWTFGDWEVAKGFQGRGYVTRLGCVCRYSSSIGDIFVPQYISWWCFNVMSSSAADPQCIWCCYNCKDIDYNWMVGIKIWKKCNKFKLGAMKITFIKIQFTKY